MSRDPFARNDRQDKAARWIGGSINVGRSLASILGGLLLVVLGALGIGGIAPIVIGLIAIAFGVWSLVSPSKL